MRNKKFAAFVLAVVMVTSLLSTNIFAADVGGLDFLAIKSVQIGNMDGATPIDVTTSSTSVGLYSGTYFSLGDVIGAVIPTSTSLKIVTQYKNSRDGVLNNYATSDEDISASFTDALPLGVTELTMEKTSGSAIVSSSSLTITRNLEAFRKGFFKVGANDMTITPTSDKTFDVIYNVAANTEYVDFNFMWLYGDLNFDETKPYAGYYGDAEDFMILGEDGYYHNKLYFTANASGNSLAKTIKTSLTFEDWYKDNNDYTYNITINRPAPTTTTPTTPGYWYTSGSSTYYTGASMGTTVVKAETMDKFIADQLLTKENIVIALKSGVNSATISQDSVTALIQNKKTLYVTKEGVTLAITPDAMTAARLDKGKFEVTLKPYTQIDIASISKMDAINKDLYKMFVDVKIKINGTEVKKYPIPLLLSFDTAKLTLTDAQKAMLTGVRIADGNSYNQLGGQFNGKKFEFYTSSLSNYGIIVSDNLVKIATTVGQTAYTLNGKTLTSDVAPTNINGSVMVPVRFVVEAFGAEVTWNDSSKTVGITLGSQNLKLTIGQKLAGMNVAPTIVDDRTLVPLRYVSETLGANIVWDDATKTVTIAR